MESMSKINNSIFISIFQIHARRIGYVRTFLGSIMMYVTIPFFVFIQITITIFLYKFLLRPFLGLHNLRIREYIIFDRHNISELNFFDRFNCLFCEYANGVTLLMNEEIDQIEVSNFTLNFFNKIALLLYLIPQTLFFTLLFLITTIPTYILVKLLGLHRASFKKVYRTLKERDYANKFSPPMYIVVLFYKISAQIIAYNLEQIESSWCPIKHIDKKGFVFPPHHQNFFHRTELELMKVVLETKGTVSKRLPKF